MAGHFQQVCEFGAVHAQCRCPGPRVTQRVTCDRPQEHADRPPVATVEVGGKVMPDSRTNPFTQPLPDLDAMSDGQTLTWMGTDAVRWARVFKHYEGRATNDDDKLMNLVSWFANAIGAGETMGRADRVRSCVCGEHIMYGEIQFADVIVGAVRHRADGPCHQE